MTRLIRCRYTARCICLPLSDPILLSLQFRVDFNESITGRVIAHAKRSVSDCCLCMKGQPLAFVSGHECANGVSALME